MRLGYYTPRFPFPQGASAGPYKPFVGRAHTACVLMALPAPRQPIRNSPAGSCGCKPHHGKCGCKSHTRRFRKVGRWRLDEVLTVKLNRKAGMGDDATASGMINILAPDQSSAGTIWNDPLTDLPLTAPNAYVDTSLDPLAAPANSGADVPALAAVPAGSTFTYSATWAVFVGVPFPGVQFGGSSLANALAAQGIQVVSESDQSILSKTNGFTLQLQTTADFGAVADVKSIVDHFVYTLVGQGAGGTMPQSSLVQTSAGSGNPNGSGLSNFLSTYGWYLAAAGAGLYLMGKL